MTSHLSERDGEEGLGGASARLRPEPSDVEALVWSEPAPPDGVDFRYDHVKADTPFGQFSIEWKGWKDHDHPAVFFRGDYVDVAHDLAAAKRLAAEWWSRKITSCLSATSPGSLAEHADANQKYPSLSEAREEIERLRERHRQSMDYSIDLQRIIEDLCHGRAIRTPKTSARHHYDMAASALENGPAGLADANTIQSLTLSRDEALEALRAFRELTKPVMLALMATKRRDDLLLADSVHRADDRARSVLAQGDRG